MEGVSSRFLELTDKGCASLLLLVPLLPSFVLLPAVLCDSAAGQLSFEFRKGTTAFSSSGGRRQEERARRDDRCVCPSQLVCVRVVCCLLGGPPLCVGGLFWRLLGKRQKQKQTGSERASDGEGASSAGGQKGGEQAMRTLWLPVRLVVSFARALACSDGSGELAETVPTASPRAEGTNREGTNTEATQRGRDR